MTIGTTCLIQMLRNIETNDEILTQRYLTDAPTSSVEAAADKACEELITNDGHCNRNNMRLLKDAGFNVTPGEQDSFGWLTGCIHTKKGIIVYG